jgi:pimeloyl-[acyl-carrier protein] methyl ester esterase
MSMAIAYHGWGFDQDCWQPWRELMAQQGEIFWASDRGYFNAPSAPPVSSPSIVFAHSYGLHLCPIAQLQNADVLVLFSSFLSFHPLAERGIIEGNSKRSRLVLAQMIRQFQADPQSVLEAFQKNCFYPVPRRSSEDHKPINSELLLDDLKGLDTCSLDVSILQKIPKILILQGAQDRIVPAEKGRELAASLPDGQYIEVDQAGHGLPFTHVDTCWSWIYPRLGIEGQAQYEQ